MLRSCVKVLFVSPHVTQNPRPFQLLAKDPRFELFVAYGGRGDDLSSKGEEYLNRHVFDRPLFDGYEFSFPRNIAPRPSLDSRLGVIQPGIIRLVRDASIVVIYGHAYVSCWLAIVTALVLRKPLVLTTDAVDLGRKREGVQAALKARVLRFLYSKVASRLFVPSSRSFQFLVSLKVPPSRIVLTPYCVDEAYLRACAGKRSREQVRGALSIPVEAKTLLVVSKLITRKCAIDVIEAMGADQTRGVHLIIAGDGPLRSEIEREAEALGVRDRVHLLGFVPYSELPSLYAASDVLIQPASDEPFGLAVLEALLLGTPVVAAEAVGSALDLIEEGRNGFTFPTRDIRQLRHCIRLVDSLHAQISPSAHVTEFTSEENASRIADCLQELIEEAAPPAARAAGFIGRMWPFERGRTRLQTWLQAAMNGRAKLVRTKLSGSDTELLVPWQDLGGGTLATFGEQDRELFRFLCAVFSSFPQQECRQSIFLDVGACFGAFALRLAQRFGCSAYAFEPHPELSQLLQRNTRLNSLEARVRIFDVALGPERGRAFMFHSAENAANSKVIADSNGAAVKMERLDSIITPEEWRRVAIAKIDVEGFEIEVLRGAEHLLPFWKPTLVLELNVEELRQRARTVTNVLRYLASVGYRDSAVLDRQLYPLRNGIRSVTNIVVPGDNGARIMACFPYSVDYKPAGSPHQPIVPHSSL